LDLENGGQPLADVDGAGVLARTLEHLRPFGRQRAQVHARALVAAVLRPHHREDPELGEVRLAAQALHDAAVLVRRQAMPVENVALDHRTAIAPTTDSKIMRPSTPPTSGSHARSGCGIIPTTLRCSLQIAAIAFTDPFGFQASSSRPSGSV